MSDTLDKVHQAALESIAELQYLANMVPGFTALEPAYQEKIATGSQRALRRLSSAYGLLKEHLPSVASDLARATPASVVVCGIAGSSAHDAVYRATEMVIGSAEIASATADQDEAFRILGELTEFLDFQELLSTKALLENELAHAIVAAPKQGPKTGRRRGRPVDEYRKKRADFAKPRLHLSWPAICDLYKAAQPEDKEVNADKIRWAYDKEYPAR